MQRGTALAATPGGKRSFISHGITGRTDSHRQDSRSQGICRRKELVQHAITQQYVKEMVEKMGMAGMTFRGPTSCA
jgi:hypothetical protein